MTLLFKLWAFAGWLIILGMIVVAVLAITGNFSHPWSNPPV